MLDLSAALSRLLHEDALLLIGVTVVRSVLVDSVLSKRERFFSIPFRGRLLELVIFSDGEWPGCCAKAGFRADRGSGSLVTTEAAESKASGGLFVV